MKRVLLAVAVFAISAASVNAQSKKGATTFSIAANAGGGTYSGGKLTAGGDLQVDVPVGNPVKLTFSGGYENLAYQYNSTPVTVVKTHISFIPLLAGVKVGFGKGFYGHGQVGYSVFTTKASNSNNNGSFTYAPSLGYGFGKNFDISAKYLSIKSLNSIVARLAYNF